MSATLLHHHHHHHRRHPSVPAAGTSSLRHHPHPPPAPPQAPPDPPGLLRRVASSPATATPNNVHDDGDGGGTTQIVTLHRNSDAASGVPGLGVTVRGGVEHGLGHFVSAVEPGSEAHLQGLRPGDQIVRVDGMSLLGATHKEAVALISSRPSKVVLEVRSVGAIPVRERRGDPVTWRSVEGGHGEGSVIQVPHSRPHEHLETRVVINIVGQQGLGCSVCRGPADKPGVFVQSTKPGGLARGAGLRPGDQVLDCNGVSFQHLEFQEAVSHLKSSRHLDLLLRKGAGADLFPSESSGYDSSSSSSNGDKKHSSRQLRHHDPRQQQLQQQQQQQLRQVGGCSRHRDHHHHHGGSHRDVSYQSGGKKDGQAVLFAKLSKSASNLTLSNRPADVSESRLRLEERLIGEERRRLEEEQERLRREGQRLEAERRRLEEEKKNLHSGRRKSATGTEEGRLLVASDGGGGVGADTNTLTLKGAIQNELQRRAAKQKAPPAPGEGGMDGGGKKKPNKALANLKNDKHDALMAEFKKAHKKMFNSSTDEEEGAEDDEEEESTDDSGRERDRDNVTASTSEDVSLNVSNSSSSTDDSGTADNNTVNTATTSDVGNNTCSSSSSSSSPRAQVSKPKVPPPPPPERTSSITPPGTLQKRPLSVFKPAGESLTKHALLGKAAASSISSTPGIPTPDYDSTPERSPRTYRKKNSGTHSTGSRYHSKSRGKHHHPQHPQHQSGDGGKQKHRHGMLRLSNSMSSLVAMDFSDFGPAEVAEDGERPPGGGGKRHQLPSSRSTSDLTKSNPSPALSSSSSSPAGEANSRKHSVAERSSGSSNNVVSLDSFSLADTLPIRRQPPKPPPFYFETQHPYLRREVDHQQQQEQQQQPRRQGGPPPTKALVSIRAYEDMVRRSVEQEDEKKGTFDFQPSPGSVAAAAAAANKSVRFKFGEEGRLASQDYRARIASPSPLSAANVRTLDRASRAASLSSLAARSPPPAPTLLPVGGEEGEEEEEFRCRRRPPSPKKCPAPPPPPPPPPSDSFSLVMQEREVEIVEHRV